MSEKKKLSEMTTDELYAEKRKSEGIFPMFMNAKSIIISFSVLLVLVLLSLYAMKDDFSYILSLIIFYLVYTFVKKFTFQKKLLVEIKSRA